MAYIHATKEQPDRRHHCSCMPKASCRLPELSIDHPAAGRQQRDEQLDLFADILDRQRYLIAGRPAT